MNRRRIKKKRKEGRQISIGDAVHICTTELAYPDGRGIPLGTKGVVVNGARSGYFNIQINGELPPCVVEIEPRLVSLVY